MKILHIDPDDIDNPLSGGGPVRTFEIYRRLANRHEITVLTPSFPGSTPEIFREGIRYVRLGRRIRDHGSSHHITFFFSLPSAIRRFEFDLLVEDFMPPMSVTMTPLLNRKPLIASVQWFFAESLSRQYRLPFFLGERYGIRMYRNFIVLTDSMKRLIEKRHPAARCEIIANGVDDSLFDVPLTIGDFVLYLGRVDFEQKGVDLLLEAYARIPEAVRLPLVMAGGGYVEQRLREMISSLRLQPWVTVVGKVASAERNRLLRDCRFTCVPSRSETFGMVIVEAAAAGKPTIVFDKWPMSEVAAPGACERVPPFDVAAYAAAIRRLTEETPAAMTARGATCRAWGGKFRWDAVSALQEAFYEEVIARDGRREVVA